MFKEIVELRKNFALVKFEGQINEDFLSYNVVFEDTKKILGEIEEISDNIVKISFLGEFINGKFYSGIIKKPSLTAKVRIINKDELSELVGDNNPKAMMLGISPLYNYPVKIDIDDMFSNHSAIFGNTGSGKTYGVARLVQNLFVMKNKIPFNSNIFIFNNTSEYDNAFKYINQINNNFNYKMYTTNTEASEANFVRIPLWLLSVDDYANILDATAYSQLAVIEKALSLGTILNPKSSSSISFSLLDDK